ncbi:MAG: hypothetical protein ABFR75_06685 [Acidobacteriota bacterium]
MKKIIILFLIFSFFLTLTYGKEENLSNNIFVSNTKGDLNKLVIAILGSKLDKLKKIVDKEELPVKIKGIDMEEDTNLIYFMAAIENYKSLIKICFDEYLPEIKKTKDKSKEFKKYLKMIKKYAKNPPIDESDNEYKKILEKKASKENEIFLSDLYLKNYSRSMVNKGEAALYLCKFMYRTREYKSEEMKNVLKYGIESLNEAYSKLPDGKKFERLTPVGMGMAAKKNTLKKLKRALSELKNK